ncbi:glycosyl transferase family 1 [Burkholderia ubonensis]|uniref:glycosyltransferase family 4 protein n=1 Tax=Burkholderia TaxID=32008 RepID=UPI0005ACAA14|nr:MULTISPECIES: glycosyltransferase family 1 protein [Burkholderia]KIP17192.1 glycosyl transferases group 1 family protein [Burkholderia sp. MSHR3999]KVD13335.1 glycosyl transferase family 1 [Burkholderia ubonensis]KVU16578.1 glycosyl transferase family 1 [Burkholderia ubonensis]
MTQIHLDVTRLLKRMFQERTFTGIDRTGLAYIERYGNDACATLSVFGRHTSLSRSASTALFEMIRRHHANGKAPDLHRLMRIAAGAQRSIPAGATLLHTSHSGAEHAQYFRSVNRRGARVVFMVHDLIPLTHAEYCRAGSARTHAARMRSALSTAAGLIANSQATLDTVTDYAARNGLHVPPTVVAKLGPGIPLELDAPAPLSRPYFVMVGTIEPRKNHWFMLHVWRRLVEHLGHDAPTLVVIGSPGWKYWNVTDMLADCEPIRHAVIHEPNCDNDRLRAWLRHARALVFPSLVEGYGMPVVEALTCRVPVLASDLPVFREYAAGVPDYLDPLDGLAWIARIIAYTGHDSDERARQMKRIETYRAPTWENHFAQVDRFLAELRT